MVKKYIVVAILSLITLIGITPAASQEEIPEGIAGVECSRNIGAPVPVIAGSRRVLRSGVYIDCRALPQWDIVSFKAVARIAASAGNNNWHIYSERPSVRHDYPVGVFARVLFAPYQDICHWNRSYIYYKIRVNVISRVRYEPTGQVITQQKVYTKRSISRFPCGDFE